MSTAMGEPNQIIQAVDEDGKFIEYITKEEGHTGAGKRHLAITVLIYNSKGQVLLQKRKHRVFDDIWDMTASSHQLHRQNGTDETDQEATLRTLKREYDITEVEDLNVIGAIDYFAQYEDVCENEHDIILMGKYDGKITLNLDVGYEYKWMDKHKFLEDIEKNPTDYSPWSLKALQLFKDQNFFD